MSHLWLFSAQMDCYFFFANSTPDRCTAFAIASNTTCLASWYSSPMGGVLNRQSTITSMLSLPKSTHLTWNVRDPSVTTLGQDAAISFRISAHRSGIRRMSSCLKFNCCFTWLNFMRERLLMRMLLSCVFGIFVISSSDPMQSNVTVRGSLARPRTVLLCEGKTHLLCL